MGETKSKEEGNPKEEGNYVFVLMNGDKSTISLVVCQPCFSLFSVIYPKFLPCYKHFTAVSSAKRSGRSPTGKRLSLPFGLAMWGRLT